MAGGFRLARRAACEKTARRRRRVFTVRHPVTRPWTCASDRQFEITQATRDALQAWTKQAGSNAEDFLFPSRLHESLCERPANAHSAVRSFDRWTALLR